ncbi:MAG: NAD(P)/FAD-dependent oxidoreductase [bacterium]|nr:NAD(P)/FAD-dependent oxidoreductase [bacterium]MCX7916779.1 NAD(P)/FAD-dependent oxidoreductase [bacterium]MDW8164631.1 NAD(P)/FAD-dependent oxidoreductase [Candidatus Omnitrophota bacterium]
MEIFDCVIIGGGPSGCFAGISASEKGKKVALVDRNSEICKKLLLTGKGKCNLTNLNEINEDYISKYKNGKFLINVFHQFSNHDLYDFFERNGLKLKIDTGKRVYPESENAEDVLKTIKKILDRNKVRLFLREKVLDIEKNKEFFEIKTDKRIFKTKKVVISTGGKSFPGTGSEGDGFIWARKFGHKIIKPVPALCGLEIKENFIKKWQGINLKNILVSAYLSEKKIGEEFGELLFTHYGVSGPSILNLSGNVSENLDKGEIKIIINFKPALNDEILDKRLQREIKENPNKILKNLFKNLLPSGLIDEFLKQSGLEGEKKVNQITRDERKIIVEKLLKFEITVKKTRPFYDSMVTRGGVCIDEINPKTMESKIVKGLYFAGEIIDVDGKTGGYNLQMCFSTGYVAGINV